MNNIRLILLFSLCLLLGCRADDSQKLTIFAAASLTDAFVELADAFEAQNEGVEVVLNFAGSSQLAAQLREGAPADLFASANPAQMQAVIAAGRVEMGGERPFATNQLTLIVPTGNPANIHSLEDLAAPGIQLIFAVEGVPVRQYSDEVLATLPADLQAQIYANLVSEEDNVRQVVAKIALGEADAGFVYTSDVTPGVASQVQQIEIPAAQNVVASYPIAPLIDAPNPTLADDFLLFLVSDEGQAILARWGFEPPSES